ncbi:hypothetical protein BX661DRAFT_53039 [Kickxella alabastrina]|uniref:uncharacterized protein n=1 Tax=Kickxella alabastrina TaxID=61397 RepID=UPI00221E9C1E|nr:uncharacterized protein BX661DRAFT_53039 [Kickxella alabastrina]KAI7823948.1 hypothetical protein BX661DRAFT_53039 [Kickxella alabastrina]
MRIKKLQHKRLNFPPQEMQPLREQLETTPINNIHEVLKPYQEWPFVRGDMYHWITVLNRFDDIMADVCEKFGLTSLQKVDFDAETRVLLVSILEFSRLLMENCINRNVYNSVERLDCLLNTSDPEVLESTLRMLLRAAHRWSYQRDVKTSLTVMSTRLMTVADTWRTNKDITTGSGNSRQSAEGSVSHTNEFKMLASGDESTPPRTSEAVVRYSFFRTADEARQLEEDAGSDQSKPQSKRSSGLATEGLVAIDAPIDSLNLDRAASRYEQVRQAFDTLVAQYRIPAAHQFELRHRIQVAMSFATGDSALRFTLLRSRICAAAFSRS